MVSNHCPCDFQNFFHHPKQKLNLLCSASRPPSLSHSPGDSNLLFIFMNFPPLTSHLMELITYLSLCLVVSPALRFQSSVSHYQNCIIFYGRIIFHFVFVPHLSSHASVCGHGFLPPFGHCEWCCMNVGVQVPV